MDKKGKKKTMLEKNEKSHHKVFYLGLEFVSNNMFLVLVVVDIQSVTANSSYKYSKLPMFPLLQNISDHVI